MAAASSSTASSSAQREVLAAHDSFLEEQLGGDERVLWRAWVTKHKRGKEQDRLLVLSEFRVLSIKDGRTGVSVQRSSHLYGLVRCAVQNDEVTLDFDEWAIRFSTHAANVEDVVRLLWRQIAALTVGFPPHAVSAFSGEFAGKPLSREALAELEPPPEQTPSGRFLAVFKAYCAYYGVHASALLTGSISQIFFSQSRELNLNALPGVNAETFFIIFMNALEYDEWFRGVSVVGKHVPDDAFAVCCNMLQSNKTLRSLTIRNGGIKRASELAAALRRNTTLEYLDLSANPIADGLEELVDGLAHHPLRVLKLASLHASHKSMDAFLGMVVTQSSVARALEHLDIANNKVSPRGAALIASWFSAVGMPLQTIDLSGTGVDLSVVFASLAKSQLQLRHLNVARNPISLESGRELAALLATHNTLCGIDISQTGIPAVVLEAVAASLFKNPKFSAPDADERIQRTLRASKNAIGAGVGVKLASLALDTPRLHTVVLDDCSLGARGVAWLCHALAGHPNLRVLSLDRNVPTGATAAAAAAASGAAAAGGGESGKATLGKELARFAKLTPGLVSLSIQGSLQLGMSVDVTPMLNALRSSPSRLTYLDISFNNAAQAGALALAQFLDNEASSSLESLRFDGNAASVADFLSVAERLSKHPSLLRCTYPQKDMVRALKSDPRSKAVDQAWNNVADRLRRNAIVGAAAHGKSKKPEKKN